MATTRFKFRASSVSGKQGTLFIQVIHKRVARQVSTSYKLYPDEWDAVSQSVVIPKDMPSDRSQYLHTLQKALQYDTSRLQIIILALDHSRKEYHAKDVVKRFLKKEQSNEFMVFAESLIDKRGRKVIYPLPQNISPHSTASIAFSKVACLPLTIWTPR